MRSDGIIRHFALAFGIALLGYAVFYSGIEYARMRKGPWHVSFRTDTVGVPSIVVNQARLGISNVVLTFPQSGPIATNLCETIVFDRARPVPFELPFGRCVFLDTTSLPGSATFELYGHEIELLPRVLHINGHEHPWLSGQTLALPRARPKAEQ